MATNALAPPEVLFMPGYGDVAARSRTIASVHFDVRDHHGFFHSKGRSFMLAPGKRSQPSYLKVWDSQQWTTDTASLHGYQQGMPKPADIPYPVAVETVVGDLLKVWRPYFSTIGKDTKGFKSQLARKPDVGIMVIAGDVATPEEIAELDRLEVAHCRSMVEEADRFHRSGDGVILDYHRKCLEWLGSERRDWYAVIEGGRMKKSPISGTRIPMEALADGGIELIEFYLKNGLNPLDFGDEFVDSLLKKSPQIRATVERRLGIAKEKEK